MINLEALAKAKKEAEAAASAAAAPPPEKMNEPIRLKDAIGRQLTLPFHLSYTWEVRTSHFPMTQ